MNISNLSLGQLSIIKKIEYCDFKYENQVVVHTQKSDVVLLYHKNGSKNWYDIVNKVKYSSDPFDMRVGDKFVDLKYTLIPFNEVLKELDKENNKNVKNNMSKRKILKLLRDYDRNGC